MKRETLDTLRAARRGRRAVTLVTDLATGAQTLVGSDGSGASGVVEAEGGERFRHRFEPTPRLVIVGAVHAAQKLAPMAQLADFAVTIVDPRESFATVERFPGVSLIRAWPDRALADMPPDSGTAMVTLTHDPKIDDPGLIAALRSPAFYVGALGSRKTHAKRLERLRGEGFDDQALGRIHAPVGLPIGALSPGEIAVSILSEIVAARRGRRLAAAE